jgi:anti-sigma-K factor RskA
MVSADGAVRLAALYDERSGEMRVSVGGAEPGAGRDFELWLIQGDRAPISLGVMPHRGQAAMPIPPELRMLVANATLAITDEPAGGTPTGVATGPVVASAPLRRI